MPGGEKTVDKAQLMRYIELEKEIQRLEGNNSLKQYEERRKAVNEVEETIKSVQRTLDVQIKQTQKEQLDVKNMLSGSIKEMFESPEAYQRQLTKEQEEYLEAKNKEEVTRQTMEGLKKQQEELEAKANELKGDAEKLKKLYEERDTLLSDIFNGEYGSDLENRLEGQFDMLMEKKQRISVAHYKWISAKTLLVHAVNQLQTAVAKWVEVGKIDGSTMMEVKYRIATEARNNNIAAIQNITTAANYLGDSIKFPYATKQEMETLRKATENCYIDMQSPQRHSHAFQCYDVTMRRAGALLQWFNNVISQTIQVDLTKATQEARKVEQELRAERIKLIRAKIEESGESTKDLNLTGLKGMTDGFSAVDQAKMSEADMEMNGIGICRPEGVGEDPNLPDMKKMSVQEELRPPPTPIPLSDLAPLPSEKELFGDINELKEQYKKNTEEYMKAQQMNKARMEQGLQAKLQERRHRRKEF